MGAILQQLLIGGVGKLMGKRSQSEQLRDSWAWKKRQDKKGLMDPSMPTPRPEIVDEPYADLTSPNNSLGQNNLARTKWDEKAAKRKAEADEHNSPTQRWKRHIDNMMRTGHPQLQKEAMGEMLSYRQRTVQKEETQRATALPSNVREYQWARQNNGFKGSLAEWMQSKRPTTNINTSSNHIKAAEAARMVDSEGNPVDVPVGTTYEQGTANGWSFGHRPDAEEAKTMASMDLSEDLLGQLDTLISEGADISGVRGLVDSFRSEGTLGGVIADNILSGYGYDMNDKDVRAMSISVALGNQLLQAFRGAAVGPEEKADFIKQLPTAGQPKDVFRSNLEQTRKNLLYIRKVKQAKRFGTSAPEQNKIPSNLIRSPE